MINFVIALAIGIGVFLGFSFITDSTGLAVGAGVIALIIAMIAVGFYTGQRKEQISKNEEVPLEKDRTPEKENKQGYNPDSSNEKRIKDPTK
ncbi:hypothetical protein E2R51_10145 [Jeotgalibacillus sp. S-D1]|uniref:hypothetical protein n=1 Tax=Jeotgalibacillus sp. S-D1 TaxID=2552189 RepID=UPI001059A945|nr:hypothetical protein [Jeotgalibacillus sp. S-D1]TDL33012.1 hypothetical protein E2R51_10145 [Jeotgalibacillus sp. S-D1]